MQECSAGTKLFDLRPRPLLRQTRKRRSPFPYASQRISLQAVNSGEVRRWAEKCPKDPRLILVPRTHRQGPRNPPSRIAHYKFRLDCDLRNKLFAPLDLTDQRLRSDLSYSQ